jgi:hypothetical protein
MHGQTWMSHPMAVAEVWRALYVCGNGRIASLSALVSHSSRWASTDEHTDTTYDVMNSSSSCDGHMWRRSIRPAF